jgi:L-ascorbate metabolism protein UlaG (beta-lactamase superfamily)
MLLVFKFMTWLIKFSYWSLYLIVTYCVAACAIPKPTAKWQRAGIVPPENQIVRLDSNRKGLFKLVYLGSGSVVLAMSNGEAVLTDPFYSNTSLLKTGFGHIQTQPENVIFATNKIKNAGIDLHRIHSVLVAHTHYDHLLDVPYLLKNNLLDSNYVKVYGSVSTKNVLQKFAKPHQLVTIEDSAFYQFGKRSRQHGWFWLSKNIRMLPIEARHAAHFKVLGVRLKFLNGMVGAGGIKNFEHPLSPTKSSHWREGNTYAYLIDYMVNDTIVYRTFIQTSSCACPYGFPPEAELEKKAVDLAILGVASANMVKPQNYPQLHLKWLKPKHIVLVHWEDFFQDYQKNYRSKTAKTVAITNFGRFFENLNIANDSLKASLAMPLPGTVFEIGRFFR